MTLTFDPLLLLLFLPTSGGALLAQSPEPAGTRWHRLVLLEELGLLLAQGRHHDDAAAQLPTAPVAVATQ